MPPGSLLYGAGLICLVVFAVRESREHDPTPPTASGWLLLGLGCLCILAGTVRLAVTVFSG